MTCTESQIYCDSCTVLTDVSGVTGGRNIAGDNHCAGAASYPMLLVHRQGRRANASFCSAQGANTAFVVRSVSACSIASYIAAAEYPSAVVINQLRVHRSPALDGPPYTHSYSHCNARRLQGQPTSWHASLFEARGVFNATCANHSAPLHSSSCSP